MTEQGLREGEAGEAGARGGELVGRESWWSEEGGLSCHGHWGMLVDDECVL